MNRRTLIGSGIAAALLAVAGLSYEIQPESDSVILRSIARVMLAGALPTDPTEHERALDEVVRGFDVAVAGLPPSVQREIAQLFTLLRVGPARMLAAGVMHPWHLASSGEIERFLNGWQFNRIAKLRSAYEALHALVFAAWYATSASWGRIGYPGPPKVS